LVTKRFAELQDEAGLRHVRLHDLRHGMASLMLAAGADMVLVQKRVGHSSLSLTADTYTHMVGSVGRQAAEAAAALVPRLGGGEGSAAALPLRCQSAPENDDGRSPAEENAQVRGGAPPGTRTPNPRIKSPLLCQLS
jgi:hypothetical protein